MFTEQHHQLPRKLPHKAFLSLCHRGIEAELLLDNSLATTPAIRTGPSSHTSQFCRDSLLSTATFLQVKDLLTFNYSLKKPKRHQFTFKCVQSAQCQL